MATALVLDGSDRIRFISESPLSVADLVTESQKHFKCTFSLMHNGEIVDNSLQVSDYGDNPVFVLVRREKHRRDEKVVQASKHPRM
jgi:hypothetical protein